MPEENFARGLLDYPVVEVRMTKGRHPARAMRPFCLPAKPAKPVHLKEGGSHPRPRGKTNMSMARAVTGQGWGSEGSHRKPEWRVAASEPDRRHTGVSAAKISAKGPILGQLYDVLEDGLSCRDRCSNRGRPDPVLPHERASVAQGASPSGSDWGRGGR